MTRLARPVRVAVIGCGDYGSEHARLLTVSPAAEVRILYDVRRDAAERLRGELRGIEASAGRPDADVRVAASAEEAVTDPGIDAVWICTHHDSHAPLAEAAARAGRHVFIEKPLALTLDDCDRIVSAVEHAGVHCMTGFKFRFQEAVRRAAAHVPAPALSSFHAIDDRWPDAFWANDPVRGGGNVLSEGCHIVDLACALHPFPPVRVTADGGNVRHPDLDIIDTLAMTLRFADGAVAAVTIGDSGRPPGHASKFGAMLSAGDRCAVLTGRLTTAHLRSADGVEAAYRDDDEHGVREEVDAFLRVLCDAAPNPCDARAGRRATAILCAAIESLRQGCAVDLATPPYADPRSPEASA